MNNNDIVTGFDETDEGSLKIRLRKIDNVVGGLILTLTGYIDTYNSSDFQKRVKKAIDSGFIKLIFNCDSLNYISSTGIGTFTDFLKLIKPRGGDLVLINLQPKVFEVFQLLGFTRFFNISNDLNESISKLHGEQNLQKQSAFPGIISCPICSKKLKAVKPGRFRCSDCKSILAIDETCQVLLG